MQSRDLTWMYGFTPEFVRAGASVGATKLSVSFCQLLEADATLGENVPFVMFAGVMQHDAHTLGGRARITCNSPAVSQD